MGPRISVCFRATFGGGLHCAFGRQLACVNG